MIALDIGNSRMKAGVGRPGEFDMIAAKTHPLRKAEEYIRDLGLKAGADAVIVSSVVDELSEKIKEMSLILSGREPLIVSHEIRTGLKFPIDNPEKLGPDRIANAVGGYEAANGPVIVVDLGTAVTLSVVGRDAEFLGGCIMPGPAMMSEALNEKTSKLPQIEFGLPGSVIGKNTRDNIRAGLSYGIAGAVERMIDEIRGEIDYTISVLLTGGMCSAYQGLIRNFNAVDPLLTLKGLFRIYEMQNA